MTATQTVVLVVVLLLVAAVVGALVTASRRKRRSEQLRSTFGSEYDRTVQHADSRQAAERELAERQQRHAELEIRPLAPESRERYLQAWSKVQAHFVDQPVLALTEADALVTRLMGERGFPTDGPEEQAAMLSVEHQHVLDSFRAGHAIEERNTTRSADTEQVRQGMLHFRAVFEGLVDDAPGHGALHRAPDAEAGSGRGPGETRHDPAAGRTEHRTDDRAAERAQDAGPDSPPSPSAETLRVERADGDHDLAQSRLADGRPAVVVRDSTQDAPPPAAPGPSTGGGATGAALRPIVPPGGATGGDGEPREPR